MRLLPLGLAVALLLASVPAQSAVRTGRRGVSPVRLQKAGKVQDFDFSRRIDVNTINMFTTNIGSTAWDLNSGNAGLIWPKGTTNTSVFAAGLWLAGTVSGQTRMAVAEYTQDFTPGPMEGGTFIDGSDPRQPSFVVYKVARFTGDPSDTAHVDRNSDDLATDPLLDPLVHHSWSEYMNGAAPYGAPVRYYHLNASAPDDSVLGPDVLGDQMLWTVYNDADPSLHGGDFSPATLPLGLEIQQTTFGFNRQGPLANTVFLRYKLFNKGSSNIDSLFISQWCDPDLGGFTDDLVGCDTTLSLGYCYNATNHDQIYGSRPPAEGFDFFLGPRKVNGDTLPMTSFNKYINGTDPASPTEVYRYMNGVNGVDGTPVVDPNGVTTKFFHAGDPVTGQGWLDNNPADRRFLMSSGPFSMAPGDSQVVVVAFLIAQGRDRLSSISGLRFFDEFAQAAFDSSFLLPSPPPQPKVNVAVNNGSVTLCWDAAARTNYPKAEDHAAKYKFEGYNVYQGETVAGPWHLVATYDEIDQIRVIFDQVFDPVTGQTIPSFPVAFGGDNGVQFCHTATQDAITGNSLHNGTAYYFAVTAYAFDPNGLPKVLENSQQAIRAIPEGPALGTDLATAKSTCPVHLEKDPTALPLATTRASVEIVNADSVLNHIYKIGFGPLPSPVIVGTDSNVTVGWSLVDSTTSDTLLRNQANLDGSDDYQVIRGMRVRVVGSHQPVPELAEGAFLCLPEPLWPLAGNVALQGPAFGGGLILPINDPRLGAGADPSSDPDSFSTVEIRFSHTQKQKVYRYLLRRTGASPYNDVPDNGSGYRYAGFVEQPFTVWDTDHNIQLDAGFVEKVRTDQAGTYLPPSQQPATFDSLWAPNNLDDGNRELLFVYRSAYTDTAKTATLAVNNVPRTSSLQLYELWPRKVSVDATIKDGDVFRILWNGVPPSTNDVFAFGTTALVRNNAALARGGLSRVRVVPNPYYTRSRYELNQFSRVVRFINLPEVCTVRIFNLAGELVRTLRKTDATTSTMDWDIQTENRLPVASGVYIFHVDAPGVGSTFGRMVIFMEKERLNSL